MTQATADAEGRRRRLGIASRIRLTGNWLHPYLPRLRDRHFWVVQALILVVALVHGTVESLGILQQGAADLGHSLSFVPVTLYFVPVVYAALSFGSSGAIATAVWCTLVTIPDVALFHQGFQRLAELFQVGVVDGVAVFVGQRVDREQYLRRRSEISEAKYRGLFESSPAAVLVVDAAGVILEANPAAHALFGREQAPLRGDRVVDLIGTACAAKLAAAFEIGGQCDECLVLRPEGDSEIYLEPTVTRIDGQVGEPVVQILFRNVTLERSRQAGLRAYAAHVVAAQEEERKRIAQELHDDAVQSLILLCRRLDLVAKSSGPLPDLAISRLREVRRAAEAIVEGLRDFARALRPPTLDDLGLAASIRRLLTDLADRAGSECSLEVTGVERRLSPDVELALFRIAQESLRNVERHAGASHVTVNLGFGPRETTLEVFDDGTGFEPPSSADLAAGGHLGLLGMRERAECLNGSLEIESAPGQGTSTRVSIPDSERVQERAGAGRDSLR